MTMKVNVLIFGPLKDVTGTHVCQVTDVADTAEMIAKMNRMYPGLDKLKFLIAVEKEIVHGNTTLSDNFTVALLPPYSGG
jgi:sulfur-carrier protein